MSVLFRAKDLVGRNLQAKDGEVGRVKDLFFDEGSWTIRYLVVDTGGWLNHLEVLVVPAAVQGAGLGSDELFTNLTKEQVENSPPVRADMPLSRHYEERLHTYYGWMPYWSMPTTPIGGIYAYPVGAEPLSGESYSDTGIMASQAQEELAKVRDEADPDLRSFKDMTAYAIAASDGDLGHVVDMLLDIDDWRVTHIIVDTRSWLPGKHVVIDKAMVKDVDWEDRKVGVALSREAVKDSPEYDPAMQIDDRFQTSLSDYYRRLAAWNGGLGILR